MQESNNTEKFGNIRKCPYCGAPISGVTAKCPECGHEFSNISANSTIQNLTESLAQIDRRGSSADAVKRKIQIIQNFPVPNTKEDIIEILTICRSNMESKAENPQLKQAWRTKALQMISKSEMLLKGDKDAEYLIKAIKADEARKKKRITTIVIIVLVVIGLCVGGMMYYHSSSKAEIKAQSTELTTMKSDINKLIKEGNYDTAFEKMDDLKNYMVVHETEHLDFESVAGDVYMKLVVALIQEEDLQGAALVGLDYREKLNDDRKWLNSQVFKVLVQECEAQNVDDSPLR